MILYPDLGSYSPGQMHMLGGFQLGATPTVLRDGTRVASASKMFTVTRVSAGLYTVTFNDKFPIPARPFIQLTLQQAAAPVTPGRVHEVKASWSQSTRSFQIQCQTVGTTPAASDLDATDRVNFRVEGAISSAGEDPA